MRLTYEPLVSPALWTTLAVALLAALVLYGLRRPVGFPKVRWAAALGLMTIASVLVLLVLLNPTWLTELPPPAGKPRLTLLVDTSASMATPDAARGGTRLAAAAAFAGDVARELGDRFDVQVTTFDSVATAAAANQLARRTADGSTTDLAAALDAGLAADQPQGQLLVLASDGIHNAGSVRRVFEAARRGKELAAPVYTLAIGGDETARDVAVDLHPAQELAAVGQSVPIAAVVSGHGFAAAAAEVTLRHEGAVLERRTVSLADDRPVEVRFEVQQAKTGIYRYEIETSALPGEVSVLNNACTFVLRVIDQPVRALLLEGKPYWDGKFLMRVLASDPAIELRSIVRLTEKRLMERALRRPPDATAVTTTAPATAPVVREEQWRIAADPAAVLTSADALKDVQIVVLGREVGCFLTDEVVARLRNWVAREGGALVCYRGAPEVQISQPLGALMPVRWAPTRETRFRMAFTERGHDLGWIAGLGGRADDALASLPPLATAARTESSKPMTVVLASAAAESGDDIPVVTYQPYGTGRVVVVEGAGMWRWAFLHPAQHEQDAVYQRLWNSLLRWLVSGTGLLPGQPLALRVDKVGFDATEVASATLLLRAELPAERLPTVALTGDTLSAPQTFQPSAVGDEPGAYRVTFGRLPEGHYAARVVDAAENDTAAQVAFDVRSFLGEQLDLRARPDLLARLAEESGGAVLTDDPVRQIAARYAEYTARVRPPRVQRQTAWDRWWLLVGVFAAWGTAWTLRRSGGLV